MVDDIDELPDLDPELRALVSAYELTTARDGAQVDAALAKVTAKAGAAGSGGAAALSTTTKIGIVSGLLGVVAVVGIAALGPTREPAPLPTTTTETARVATGATRSIVADEAPRNVDVESASAVDREQSALEEAPERAPIERTDRRAKPRASSTPPAEPALAESSLKAELELLRQARSALRGGRAARALEIVLDHRREYPTSAVAEERDATEISALCALGRHDEAEAKAAAMERSSSRPADDLLAGCR